MPPHQELVIPQPCRIGYPNDPGATSIGMCYSQTDAAYTGHIVVVVPLSRCVLEEHIVLCKGEPILGREVVGNEDTLHLVDRGIEDDHLRDVAVPTFGAMLTADAHVRPRPQCAIVGDRSRQCIVHILGNGCTRVDGADEIGLVRRERGGL